MPMVYNVTQQCHIIKMKLTFLAYNKDNTLKYNNTPHGIVIVYATISLCMIFDLAVYCKMMTSILT